MRARYMGGNYCKKKKKAGRLPAHNSEKKKNGGD